MGMKLSLSTEAFAPAEDQSWLGSKHGVDNAESVTLDADKFLTTFPTGVVPSGVVLGKIEDTGLYAPYDSGADDGSEDALGVLLTTVDLRGTSAGTALDTPAAMLWHGRVVESRLPTGHGLDSGAKSALSQIRFV